MNFELKQRRDVHRADEQGRKDHPMVERRAVDVPADPAREQQGRERLNERLHDGNVGVAGGGFN